MFQVYLDESADAKKEKIFVVAGWLGKADVWADFIPRWSDRIQREGLKSFHMTDCEARRQQFAGWDLQRKDQLVRDLTRIIDETDITACAAALGPHEFKRVVAKYPVMQDEFWSGDAYFYLFTACALSVVHLIKEHPDTVSAAFVFDQQEKIAHKMLEGFRQMKNSKAIPEQAKRLGSLTFVSRELAVPLQAADLLAYEIRKFYENRMLHPDRVPRKAIMAMSRKLNRTCDFRWSEEELEKLAKRWVSAALPADVSASLGAGNGHQPPA